MNCKNCNAILAEDAKFCTKCGTKLEKVKNKKPFKTISLIIFIILMLIVFNDFGNFGCSHVSVLEKTTCKVSGITRAKVAIKKKYGFTPKIISTNVGVINKTFDSSAYGEKLGGISLKAEHDGKSFNISGSCNIFNSNFTDDYQSNEAYEYMVEYFNSEVKRILKDNSNFVDYNLKVSDYYGYSSAFDKNNLGEEYLNLLNYLDIVILGENNISKKEIDEISKIGNGQIRILSIKSLDEYNNFMKNVDKEKYINIPENLLYSTIEINKKNPKKQYEKIKYNSVTDSNITFIKTSDNKILKRLTLSELDDIYKNNDRLDQLKYNYIQAYKVLSSEDFVIYVSSETMNQYNLSDLKLTHWRTYKYNNEIKYSVDYSEIEMLNRNSDYSKIINYEYIYWPQTHLSEDDIIIFTK